MNLTDLETGLQADYKCVRRDGSVVPFQADKIRVAIANAFIKNEHGVLYHAGHTELSDAQRAKVDSVTARVVETLLSRQPHGGSIHIEAIQDQVELCLMRLGEHKVARGYVLYREARALQRNTAGQGGSPTLRVVTLSGKPNDLTELHLDAWLSDCAHGLRHVDTQAVLQAALRDLYDGASYDQLEKSLILSARARIETEPQYSYFTARLLHGALQREVLGRGPRELSQPVDYAAALALLVSRGLESELLDPGMREFDLARLGAALVPERDRQFGYLGLQTLYDRYLLQTEGRRLELPQVFFMRVAMGLALQEPSKDERAIEFYHAMSTFDYMPSTPTLFNSGTRRAQLSSCYLTTIPDDLDGIFEGIKENALLSKFAGGLGNDWTRVRALGAHIKGTNGKSQGTVPFLKVASDTAVAVNQGGKRKGAVCAYLETWHLDIEQFLELRKNAGDDRRRTYDMNTANWIPDLFMKRVEQGAEWTLFSPNDVPNLHDLTGLAFEKAYVECEAKAARGEIRQFKTVQAEQLWRKMLTMLFETGHPWICFKDPCNVRSPQQHAGIVHSSNLCTEITLNTSDEETAVCNLGSVNLVNHLVAGSDGHGAIDYAKLRRTVGVAMRMLDNVIDINYYAVEKARTANLRHRPVGLGVMGFQDCLHRLGVAYDSESAVQFADASMEAVCFFAYEASARLAEERDVYASFSGSHWQRGILPQDTVKLVAKERGEQYIYYLQPRPLQERMPWQELRARIDSVGMRNSNCVAIAPTATIANIVGVSPSIEPVFRNLYVKSNLSGEFTVVNEYLVEELRALGLWDAVMVADLKHFDGSITKIERIPAEIRRRYATAFELDASWLIECAAERGKWIDQSQSLNLYVAGASGKTLANLYRLAWLRGLKTTYYLRALGASAAEKSTGVGGELNAVVPAAAACAIDDPACEACQ